MVGGIYRTVKYSKHSANCFKVVSPLILSTTFGSKSLCLGFIDGEVNSLGNKLQSWDLFSVSPCVCVTESIAEHILWLI